MHPSEPHQLSEGNDKLYLEYKPFQCKFRERDSSSTLLRFGLLVIANLLRVLLSFGKVRLDYPGV